MSGFCRGTRTQGRRWMAACSLPLLQTEPFGLPMFCGHSALDFFFFLEGGVSSCSILKTSGLDNIENFISIQILYPCLVLINVKNINSYYTFLLLLKSNKSRPNIPFFSAKAMASSLVLKVRTMLDKGSALKETIFFPGFNIRFWLKTINT